MKKHCRHFLHADHLPRWKTTWRHPPALVITPHNKNKSNVITMNYKIMTSLVPPKRRYEIKTGTVFAYSQTYLQ